MGGCGWRLIGRAWGVDGGIAEADGPVWEVDKCIWWGDGRIFRLNGGGCILAVDERIWELFPRAAC